MARGVNNKPSKVIQERLTRCRRMMRKLGYGTFLVSKRSDIYYLTGFTGEDSVVLFTSRGVHLISDSRFDEAINMECPWVTRWMRRGTLDAEIALVCKSLRIRNLAVQPRCVTLASAAEWKRRRKGLRIVSALDFVADMRRIKSPEELVHIRKAIRVAEDAFVAMRKTIRVGQTELELAAKLEYEMKCRGASSPSFPTIVAEGKNAALPHAHPGRRKLKKGSAILIDWGACVDGYCSDLTRVLFLGSIPRKFAAVYGVVLDAQLKAIAHLRAGRRLCDVDAAARDLIADAGYGSAFGHGLGHGIGLDVHESPRISWQSKEPLEAGSVVTVEPGIYLPGFGGVRIEDDVLVTQGGCRVLSHLGKSLADALC